MPAMAAVQTNRGRIGVIQAGAGPAVPIVFLHGVGSDKSVWRPQLAHFGQTRRCFAFDFPGYGESDYRPGATRDDFAEAILAGMDSLGVDRAIVCGLSLGGVIAIAMHHAAPQRIAGLILADTFSAHPEGQAIYDRAIAASGTMTMRKLAEMRAPLLLGSAATPAIVEEVIETMAGIDPRAYALGAAAVWLADQRDRLAVIRAPTLVIVGDEDAITPPSLSQELAMEIASAQMTILKQAGHLANLEQPALFNDAINGYLTETQ